MNSYRSHIITLFKDNVFWSSGFLSERDGRISLYPCRPSQEEFTAATLPAGVKVCPNLALTLEFAPKQAQDETAAAVRRFGYEIFEIDIVPWY